MADTPAAASSNGPALVSMAQQFTGLPMSSLIGGPLNAAAKANASMAVTQTKFILDTCFIINPAPAVPPKPNTDHTYEALMVSMTLTQGVIQPVDEIGATPIIKQVSTKLQIPLLTIIPINSLGVDSAQITFEMEVKSSFSDEQSQTTSTQIKAAGSFEVKVGWGPISATVRGNTSYDHNDSTTHSTHYQKSNSAKYTVNVQAAQLPIPKGVNKIITAFTRAITPIELPAIKAPGDGGGGDDGGGGGGG